MWFGRKSDLLAGVYVEGLTPAVVLSNTGKFFSLLLIIFSKCDFFADLTSD